MRVLKDDRWSTVYSLVIALVFQVILPIPAMPQISGIKKKAMQAVVCGGGAVGGYKIGEKVADEEAKRLKLPPEAAAAQKRAFQIGIALALCGGGSAIAGTTYSKLTKRDKEAREKELDLAVADATPQSRTYALPDHPQMEAKYTTKPSEMDGNNECRVVEDYLAEAGKGDAALVKYCRKPPSGKWEVNAF